jgi:hypothetical protein
MKKSIIDRYIYQNEAETEFYKLSDSFNDLYADKVLMSGEASNGEHLTSINFETNSTYGQLFYSVLLAGLSQSNPSVTSQLIYENRLELEFQFFDFGCIDNITHIYLIKNIMDWRSTHDFLCEIWSLKNVNIKTIKKHWK